VSDDGNAVSAVRCDDDHPTAAAKQKPMTALIKRLEMMTL